MTTDSPRNLTTLFLAGTGGHLAELDSLAGRIPPNGASVWATHANEQSRVVVTVGAATEYPFRRLFEHVVPLLAPQGALAQVTGCGVQVLWQTGDTPVEDLEIQATPVLPAAELAAALRQADIVISHAGTGSALAALNAGRYPILAIRDRAHGEQIDDHQQQLATELDRRGLALCRDAHCITIEDMLTTLHTSIRRTASPPPFELRH